MGTKGTCIIYLERYHIALQHALIPARVTISTKSYQIKELYNYFIIAREGIQSAVLKEILVCAEGVGCGQRVNQVD